MLRRVGHKGADAIAPGNTLASFRAAIESGVEMIEFDVLRPRSDFADPNGWRRAKPGPQTGAEPLLVAHDWGDAGRRTPLTLDQGLEAFTRPPLDKVELDCDLKLAGREDELVGALRSHDLVERAMVSTMEVPSLIELRRLAPELRLGWTIPRVTRPWDRKRWARPALLVAMVAARRRLPSVVARRAPGLGIAAIWIYHPLATRALADVCESIGVELIAWTVDELEQMRKLTAIGVDGICTNDPRLFGRLSASSA
jgi:glycerophosphoryl diester phosphodiesterase